MRNEREAPEVLAIDDSARVYLAQPLIGSIDRRGI